MNTHDDEKKMNTQEMVAKVVETIVGGAILIFLLYWSCQPA